MAAQGVAGGVQGVGIDHVHLFGQCASPGRGQGFGDEGRTAPGLRLQQATGGIDEAGRPAWLCCPAAMAAAASRISVEARRFARLPRR